MLLGPDGSPISGPPAHLPADPQDEAGLTIADVKAYADAHGITNLRAAAREMTRASRSPSPAIRREQGGR